MCMVSRIYIQGHWQDTHNEAENAFLTYYQKLLGLTQAKRRHVIQQIVHSLVEK